MMANQIYKKLCVRSAWPLLRTTPEGMLFLAYMFIYLPPQYYEQSVTAIFTCNVPYLPSPTYTFTYLPSSTYTFTYLPLSTKIFIYQPSPTSIFIYQPSPRGLRIVNSDLLGNYWYWMELLTISSLINFMTSCEDITSYIYLMRVCAMYGLPSMSRLHASASTICSYNVFGVSNSRLESSFLAQSSIG